MDCIKCYGERNIQNVFNEQKVQLKLVELPYLNSNNILRRAFYFSVSCKIRTFLKNIG